MKLGRKGVHVERTCSLLACQLVSSSPNRVDGSIQLNEIWHFQSHGLKLSCQVMIMRATGGHRGSSRVMSHSKVLLRITLMYFLCVCVKLVTTRRLDATCHFTSVLNILSLSFLLKNIYIFFFYLFTKFSQKSYQWPGFKIQCCLKKITGNKLMVFFCTFCPTCWPLQMD